MVLLLLTSLPSLCCLPLCDTAMKMILHPMFLTLPTTTKTATPSQATIRTQGKKKRRRKVRKKTARLCFAPRWQSRCSKHTRDQRRYYIFHYSQHARTHTYITSQRSSVFFFFQVKKLFTGKNEDDSDQYEFYSVAESHASVSPTPQLTLSIMPSRVQEPLRQRLFNCLLLLLPLLLLVVVVLLSM